LNPIIDSLKTKFSDCVEVNTYLEAVKNDIITSLSSLLTEPQQQQPNLPFAIPTRREDPLQRYHVNLVVDNSELEGAPVIMEPNPTYSKLFGSMEKEAQFGTLITNYTMIRSGSAHKANGGFLVVPIEGLLMNPLVWDSLKRTIENECIEIEEPASRLGFMITKTMQPEPIPFNAKFVIIGNPMLYNLLYTRDVDFKELFKVKADFDTVMDRIDENINQYGSFICTLCNKEGLKHLDPSAIAAVIDYSSRLADNQHKLSTHFARVADLIREANFYAEEDGSEVIARHHINKALEEKIYRSNMIQEKIQEMISRGTIIIDTEGEEVGQVNGLAVLSLGDYSFGKPSKITTSIGVGSEGIIDIEREAEMGGPTHTKGVLILSGYLNNNYAKDKPLSLTARLVFEQSYSGVDGDSASSTELYSMLSALSGVPIKQNIAVTGSVNQMGVVQAIGGVNQKVEGFYEVCKAKGLTGYQGCLIPQSNVQNLMLKEDVVEAIKDGKFHIWPAKTINEGIEVLTGMKAGERNEDGTYDEGTINYLVQKKLDEMANNLKQFKV
jgi:lon-related putative ATP-dependent protease